MLATRKSYGYYPEKYPLVVYQISKAVYNEFPFRLNCGTKIVGYDLQNSSTAVALVKITQFYAKKKYKKAPTSQHNHIDPCCESEFRNRIPKGQKLSPKPPQHRKSLQNRCLECNLSQLILVSIETIGMVSTEENLTIKKQLKCLRLLVNVFESCEFLSSLKNRTRYVKFELR